HHSSLPPCTPPRSTLFPYTTLFRSTDAPIATSVHLAMRLRKPLLIEGPAGVGKTEVAKVVARMLGTNLIRLQCYEGLDASTFATDRKSTRLNSSHDQISYAVFCLKK